MSGNIGFVDPRGALLGIKTPNGTYVAYGPLDKKNVNGIDLKMPNGEVTQVSRDQLFEFIVRNAGKLEKTPNKDVFDKA